MPLFFCMRKQTTDFPINRNCASHYQIDCYTVYTTREVPVFVLDSLSKLDFLNEISNLGIVLCFQVLKHHLNQSGTKHYMILCTKIFQIEQLAAILGL